MPISDSTLRSLFAVPDKVAIVTGGGSGIGKATCQLLASAGAKVVVSDINLAAAEIVAASIVSAGGYAVSAEADVADEGQVQAMTAQAVENFGGIDILVNNAAYRKKADFMSMSVADWDIMHAVNARGSFLCTREAIKVMQRQGKARGGAIVNISTVGAAHPTIYWNVHYDASKCAVIGLTQSTAAEFAADGIRVNAVMPGGVDTEGARGMQNDDTGFVPKGPIMMPGRLLLGTAQPIQLASAILFLVSPASSYMTGHTMAVDGGYLVG
ncbi:SDR family oxidoreductase [Novosphingobium sp. G106]|uniref:SDR family NAD(P)-dependent oxidoreductase n=1 Tax=Novosphingobium sp. G106 TaxID=2849500 RepID=UPI001C2DBDBD|nr:SDR family NAD(P)-dependent oxidoreductase [Novosphingobium sp. G106]MBV1688958.1 SDR family oxidoreductase [Novosphingobium sp. G106]